MYRNRLPLARVPLAPESAIPFAEASVALVPQATGVYFLYRHGRLVYIGVAVHGSSLREELERHRLGVYGAATMAASAFAYEVTRDPIVASRQYLEWHMARYGGRLPVCNEARA